MNKNIPDCYSVFNGSYQFIIVTCACYAVITGVSDHLSHDPVSTNPYLQMTALFTSIVIGFGCGSVSLYANTFNQKKNQNNQPIHKTKISFDNFIGQVSISECDYNSYEDINDKKELTYYDKYLIMCAVVSNLCFSMFPAIFLLSMFLKPDDMKGLKSGVICASAFFGGLSSVAPIRNTTNLLKALK